MNWKQGDRVRMIHSDESVGTVAGPFQPGAGADGLGRIPVRWDRTGATTDWNPGFLRPLTTRADDDPDEVAIGNCLARRGKVFVDGQGVTIVRPGGFFAARVEAP